MPEHDCDVIGRNLNGYWVARLRGFEQELQSAQRRRVLVRVLLANQIPGIEQRLQDAPINECDRAFASKSFDQPTMQS